MCVGIYREHNGESTGKLDNEMETGYIGVFRENPNVVVLGSLCIGCLK